MQNRDQTSKRPVVRPALPLAYSTQFCPLPPPYIQSACLVKCTERI